ncbi:MAG: hypothetical protein JW720_14780 [Sedimentisphaerales bacterium]|nr:hypothetical protein [Sedimentisphaerales bacterium]
MRQSPRILFTALLALLACEGVSADTVLFDDNIDSRQKTEIRYDVPNGCVITGLGFRANYDNITTMHVRYHRITADAVLIKPHEVLLGSEPNHACEAKILLPEGYVAVGFGAAGEPEWDVTLLRIWARPLNPDGTLGEIRVFNDGFKPAREPERSVLLSESDRVLTGAGLRFASNDIGGIYARSKRILNLTDKDRTRIADFKTRAWVVSGSLQSDFHRTKTLDDAENSRVTRIDILDPVGALVFPPRDQFESHLWLPNANLSNMPRVLERAEDFSGIVLDLESYHKGPNKRDPNELLNLIDICRRNKLQLTLRLDPHRHPLCDDNIGLVESLPPDVRLIVPLSNDRSPHRPGPGLDFAAFGGRNVIVEFDLVRRSMASCMVPDVRIDEMPGLVIDSALAGAAGFIVRINISRRELLDGVNSISLQALNRFADDPFQSADVVWRELCNAKYGPAARNAEAALRRTAAINDLTYRIFGYPMLWDGSRIRPGPALRIEIEHYPESLLLTPDSPIIAELLEPAEKTIDRADEEKKTALSLAELSVNDAELAAKAAATAQTLDLAAGMKRLQSLALFWQNVVRAHLLAEMYAIDGAPATRARASDALKGLSEEALALDDLSPECRFLLFDGLGDFTQSIIASLSRSDGNALLTAALREVSALAADTELDDAASELQGIILSDRFAPHIDKQNSRIAEIASSLPAFGRTSDNIMVMRHGDGRWLIEKVAGRWCWAIGRSRPCLYLDFIPGRLERPADYTISFEYFDQGNWDITFHYDSVYTPDKKREYHPAKPLRLTGTNTWKKAAFILTNCRFASRQNAGADMRFVTGAGAKIRNISLRRLGGKMD